MTFAAEFVFKHEDIFLKQTLDAHDAAHIRVAYAAEAPDTELDGELAVFIYLLDHPDHEAFEASLDADTTVCSWSRLYSDDYYCAYSLLTNKAISIYAAAAEMGIFIDQVWSENGQWCVRMLLPSRGLLKELRLTLDEMGVRYSLESLQAYTPDGHTANLTEGQFELLKEAYEYGYFQVPRGISQSELADRHDISESAVSQQIRRGMQRVLTSFFHRAADSPFS